VEVEEKWKKIKEKAYMKRGERREDEVGRG
jgi:hypothetical protein